jgi:hypothetical protein
LETEDVELKGCILRKPKLKIDNFACVLSDIENRDPILPGVGDALERSIDITLYARVGSELQSSCVFWNLSGLGHSNVEAGTAKWRNGRN